MSLFDLLDISSTAVAVCNMESKDTQKNLIC